MNAATVIGPRSRITSLSTSVFPDRHEHLAFVAPPHENLRDAARLHALKLAAGLRGVRHALAVHRQDDVTRPQLTDGRAVRIHIRDERARLAGRHLELTRAVWRQVLQRDAEALVSALIVGRLLLAVPIRSRRLLRP